MKKPKESLCICLALGWILTQAQPANPIKWACIGNSITAGVGAATSYPSRLGTKLGPAFLIENDGVSATTLLKKGDLPYWTKGRLTEVFAFKPDIITIKLGTNDTKPQNWQYGANFAADLSALIDTLSSISTHPKLFLVLPVPIFPNGYGIRDSILRVGIIPVVNQVATAKGLNIIDVYNPLKSLPSLFPDGVHPNDAGADSIASIIYRSFMAKSIRVACVGNSITQYVGSVGGAVAKDAYATKLNMLLGRNYYVNNYGVSGAYMQKSGPSPYWSNGMIPKIFAFQPSIITIKLGTNDSRAQYWSNDRFMIDSKAMIDTFATHIAPKPSIWPCLPMPAWQVGGVWPFSGINGNIIRDSVVPSVRKVATQLGLPVIDVYTPFLALQSLVADGVHPNAAGQDTIAHILYRALTKPVTISLSPALKPKSGFSSSNQLVIRSDAKTKRFTNYRCFAPNGKRLSSKL